MPPSSITIEETERNRENVKVTEEKTCPDGGWGWVVVAASSLIRIVKSLLPFGILFAGVLMEIDASSSMTGWIYNLFLTMDQMSKFFAGPLGDVIGWRRVVMSTGIMCSLCTFALMYTSSVSYMIIFFSLGYGMAIGLTMSTSYLATACYFDKNRGKAMGILSAGLNIGKFIGPIFVTFLLEKYGYKGTLLLISALQLNLFAIGAVMHPVEWHMNKPKNETLQTEQVPMLLYEKQKREDSSEKNNHNYSKIPWFYIVHILQKSIIVVTPVIAALKSNFNALRSYRSIVFSLIMAMYLGGSLNFYMIIPFQMQSKSYTLKDAAICISINALSCAFSQTAYATLSDWNKFNKILVLHAGMSGMCISIIGFTFASSRRWLFAVSSLTGIFHGTFVLLPLVMMESLGMTLYKATYGISGIFIAGSSLVIGPLLGWVRDLSGSYDLSMRLSAGGVLISLFSILLLPIAAKLDIEKAELQQSHVSDIDKV